MIIWTIQPPCVWHQLQSTGELTTNTELLIADWGETWNWVKEPYEWLAEQMSQRISPRPGPNTYPLWGWYQYNGINHKRPDLRHSAHVPRGEPAVMLKVEIPKQDLLLSDFILWHAPLNMQYLEKSNREELRWKKLLKTRNATGFATLDQDLRELVEKSWLNIFELDKTNRYWGTTLQNRCIQATFWKLSINQVQEVTHFIGR